MTCTGVVVVTDGEMVEFSTIKTTPKDNMYKRSLYVGGKVNEYILKYPNHEVVLEAPAFMGKGSRVYQLFGFHYFVATLIFRHKGNFTQVPPTTLKKFATGSGKAKKEDMFEVLPTDIKKKFLKEHKKSTGIYDLADAYALANYEKG